MAGLLLAFVMGPAFARFCLHAQIAETSSLVGVWGIETVYGTPVEGELTVDARGAEVLATIAGHSAQVTRHGDKITFTLAGGAGEFRGSLDKTQRIIDGQWIQPPGDFLNSRYASPVVLKLAAPSVWTGIVVPLQQHISVYVSISQTPTGQLTAFIRNSEMNLFHRRVFTVTRDASVVHLMSDGWKLDGTFDEKADTLTLPLMEGLPSLKLSRRQGKDAVGFYPRDEAAYRYLQPVAEDDGWTTASLAAEALDEKPVRELVQAILTADPGSNKFNIQSLLVARHGHLVLEEYFYGFYKDRVHDTRSAGKTFAPLLVGLAKESGTRIGPDTAIYPLFSRYSAFDNWDSRKSAVRLRDIMTMTAGNACDDNDDKSPGNEDTMQDNSKQPDWYKYTLDLPMLKQPGGENAVYCSGDLNLVGGAVAAATGEWLPDFFAQHLARPLHFKQYYLNLMADGQAYMAGGAYLRPRDELKLGQVFLDGGVWNGKRIVSESWVKDSTSFHSRFDPKFSLGQEHQYGYGWHINFLRSAGKTYRAFAAQGNGGQFVIVIPELDMVIGMNGGSYGEFDKWYRWELDLVPKFLIPSAVPRGPGGGQQPNP